jgi:hypothetical protein
MNSSFLFQSFFFFLSGPSYYIFLKFSLTLSNSSIFFFLYHRNRLCELQVHQQRLDDDTKQVLWDAFSESTIAYLMKNAVPGTNEVPFNTVKKINVSGKGMKSLKFEGFELRKNFPQNVCLLKDGNIFLCDGFDRSADAFIITGKRARKVRNVYVGPEGCSRSVGVCEVEGFQAASEKIVASSVAAKCFALPCGRVTSTNALKNPTDGGRWFVSALIE